MWPYLETDLYKEWDKNEIVEWSLIQYEGVLIKEGNLDTEMCRNEREWEETWVGKVSFPQVEEKVLEQIFLSQPSEGTNLADTLILDF